MDDATRELDIALHRFSLAAVAVRGMLNGAEIGNPASASYSEAAFG
jgi:hypothetical protein